MLHHAVTFFRGVGQLTITIFCAHEFETSCFYNLKSLYRKTSLRLEPFVVPFNRHSVQYIQQIVDIEQPVLVQRSTVEPINGSLFALAPLTAYP